MTVYDWKNTQSLYNHRYSVSFNELKFIYLFESRDIWFIYFLKKINELNYMDPWNNFQAWPIYSLHLAHQWRKYVWFENEITLMTCKSLQVHGRLTYSIGYISPFDSTSCTFNQSLFTTVPEYCWVKIKYPNSNNYNFFIIKIFIAQESNVSHW